MILRCKNILFLELMYKNSRTNVHRESEAMKTNIRSVGVVRTFLCGECAAHQLPILLYPRRPPPSTQTQSNSLAVQLQYQTLHTLLGKMAKLLMSVSLSLCVFNIYTNTSYAHTLLESHIHDT